MKNTVLQIPSVSNDDLPNIPNNLGVALYNPDNDAVQITSNSLNFLAANADNTDFLSYGGMHVASSSTTLGAEYSDMQLQVVRNGFVTNWLAYISSSNTVYLGFTNTIINLPGYVSNVLLATDIDKNIVQASSVNPYAINISGNAATATLATNVTTNANLTGDVTSVGNATTLATVNASPNTYGSSTQVPVFVVNSKGLVTSVTNTTITGVAPGGSAGGSLTGTYPNPTVANLAVTNAMLAGSIAASKLIQSDIVLAESQVTNLTTDLAAKLNLSGGTLTGALTLNADAAAALQPVTLQQLNAALVGLWDDRGNYNASVNAYPSSGGSGTAGAILKGDIWTISVAGTLPTAQVVEPGDTVRALADTPGNTQANWAISQNNIGYTPLSNVLTSAQVFVGNVSNVATGVALSGAIAITNAGVTSINNLYVTNAMIANTTIDLTAKVTGVLPNANGGTNQSTYTLGDLLYSSASNTLSKLAGNTTTAKQYLSQTGNGSVSAAPAWATIAGADITGAALTKADDTNVTLTLGGTPTTALLRAASITVGWSGTLSAARGGVGSDSSAWAQGDIPYISATGVWNHLAKNTSATRYLSNTGTSNNPAWAQIDLTNGVTGVLPNTNTTAASTNIVSTIVARDGSGNFSANIITASLTGAATSAANLIGGALGSIPYQTASSTTSLLAGNTTTTVKALLQTGNGSASAAPAWTAIPTSIAGTTDQVNASASTGAVTLSLPQSIATSSSPTFSSLTITNSFSTIGGYPAFECRAWVNFNGTGTVAIRASANVSSVSDNGTGAYTVNLASSMPDANFSVSLSVQDVTNRTAVINGGNTAASVLTTSAIPIATVGASSSNTDMSVICCAIFR